MGWSTKKEARRALRAARAGLAPARRAIEEDVVTGWVLAQAAWQQARTVAVYQAVGTELSTVGVVNAAWRAGKRTVFPRVADDRLTWHPVGSWRHLAPRASGVSEPVDGLGVVAPEDVNLWLVPGVGFTPERHRLGQGGGHYDRTLVARRPGAAAWGLAFDAQVVGALPVEGHDVPVDRVVAPRLVGIDLTGM